MAVVRAFVWETRCFVGGCFFSPCSALLPLIGFLNYSRTPLVALMMERALLYWAHSATEGAGKRPCRWEENSRGRKWKETAHGQTPVSEERQQHALLVLMPVTVCWEPPGKPRYLSEPLFSLLPGRNRFCCVWEQLMQLLITSLPCSKLLRLPIANKNKAKSVGRISRASIIWCGHHPHPSWFPNTPCDFSPPSFHSSCFWSVWKHYTKCLVKASREEEDGLIGKGP